MGLPRYLKELHSDIIIYYQTQKRSGEFEKSKFWQKYGKRNYSYMWHTLLLLFANYSIHLKEPHSFHRCKRSGKTYFMIKEVLLIVLKMMYLSYDKKNRIPTSERLYFKWFDKIEYNNGNARVEYIWLKINPENYEVISNINFVRKQKAQQLHEEREKIEKLKNTTYSRRGFPVKLRMLIFERDNFRCQYCGITQEECLSNNINLEVHHIKEWEDGGETNYSNGITCCSKCNKGLHYTKKLNLNLLSENIPSIFFPFLYIIHYIIQL